MMKIDEELGQRILIGARFQVRCTSQPGLGDKDKYHPGGVYDVIVKTDGGSDRKKVYVLSNDLGKEHYIGVFGSGYIACFEAFLQEDSNGTIVRIHPEPKLRGGDPIKAYDRAMSII